MRRVIAVVAGLALVAAGATVAATTAGTAAGAAGGKIVFQSNRNGHFEIYSIRTDGSGMRRLTSTYPVTARKEHDAMWPRWSPDGKRIVFQIGPDDLLFGGQIYVMNADGSGKRRLTSGDPVTSPNVLPAWSPSGKLIAYVGARPGESHIYVMDANGGHRRAITPRGEVLKAPEWSPDGKTIAWTCSKHDRSALCAVSVVGGAVKTIWTAPSDFLIGQTVSWSPDGRRIAFAGGPLGIDVYVIGADGKGLRRLTTDRASASPAWSPDGRQIVFSSDRSYHALLYVMNADGTRQTRLTANPGQDEAPDWSAAGGRL